MQLFNDLGQALRTLLRAPAFSMLAIAVLALGIGASTAMYSAIRGLLLDSVPYPQPQQLVMISGKANDGAAQALAFGNVLELRARSHSFDGLAAMLSWQPGLSGQEQPERLIGQRVGAAYFQVLGITPTIGPGFDPGADHPQGQRLVVISDSLWQRHLQGDPSWLGRDIRLDGEDYTVAGILPPGFVDVLAHKAEIWTLLQYDPALPAQGREWGNHLRTVGRLKPGLGIDRAAAEIAQIAANPSAEFNRPEHASLQRGGLLQSLQDALTLSVRPGLLAAFGAVFLLLLTACVNVANLLLLRGAQGHGELQARAALGASPARLLRQLLTENLLLAGIAAVFGLLLAELGLRALLAWAPPGLAGAETLSIDGSALVFASILAGAIGTAVGLMPVLGAAGLGGRSRLQPGAQRIVGGRRRARNTLVVIEVALAVVLLIGAGLLLRSLDRLFSLDPGFDPEQLLTLQLYASGDAYPDDTTTQRFFDEALRVVQGVAGVESAALTSQLPLSGDSNAYGVRFESLADEPSNDGYNSLRYAVSPGYFATMRIPLLAGRALSAQDSADAPLSAVISASLARRHFGAASPIGRRVQIGAFDSPWFTVVGVAGDVSQASLAASQSEAIYLDSRQWHFADAARSFVIRAQGDAGPLLAALRQAVWSVDKDMPISRATEVSTLVADSAAERRFASNLFAAFGLAALLLAAIGIYAVLSVDIAERRNEIGLRMALGARSGVILRWAMGQSLSMIALGIALGLVLASVATRVLQSLLFEIGAHDAGTFAAAAAILGSVAALASLLPLRRALRVDPVQALRCD